MMLYARSCERPSKSSARVFLPSSLSNTYRSSTGTHGRSRRFLLISSFRSACSASSLASSSRAACHSSRVPMLCSDISSPSCQTRTVPHEPIPSSDRTLPGSRNETGGDPKTHRKCPRTAARAHASAAWASGRTPKCLLPPIRSLWKYYRPQSTHEQENGRASHLPPLHARRRGGSRRPDSARADEALRADLAAVGPRQGGDDDDL